MSAGSEDHKKKKERKKETNGTFNSITEIKGSINGFNRKLDTTE